MKKTNLHKYTPLCLELLLNKNYFNPARKLVLSLLKMAVNPITVFQAWIGVCHQIFVCWEVQNMWNFKNKDWCVTVIFWPSTRPKSVIPRWCTGRKWHIPMVSNRKRSRGWIKADNIGQGEGPTVPLQSDAPEESDLWTAWQLFPLDDD